MYRPHHIAVYKIKDTVSNFLQNFYFAYYTGFIYIYIYMIHNVDMLQHTGKRRIYCSNSTCV